MMKKILMTFILCFSVLFANAQIATENSKIFDNIYAGIEAGVTTPLNFNSIFPLNTVAGFKLGKEITPIVGFELEALAAFNDNNFARWSSTTLKTTDLGLAATINLSNLFYGYKGTPRNFEVKTNTGVGWLYYWKDNTHDLLVKTALDFDFNLGKAKQHTLTISPGIYWNVSAINNEGSRLQFNKNYAQLALLGSYVYHFKTSNGTHHFKIYDVGAMMDEINYLNDELAKKPKEIVTRQEVEVVKTVTEFVQKEFVVQFAQNSSQLSEEAKEILDEVKGRVKVTAYASPEGASDYNQALSEKRAAVITDYLTKKNVKVIGYRGLGSLNETSNRLGIIETVSD